MALPFDIPVSEKVQAILDNPPMLMDIYHEQDILGEGFNAMVLEVDEHWVIRASIAKTDGWRVISRLNHRLRERLSLPRVLATWEDNESFNHKVIELSLVERLEELEFGVDYTYESPNLERMNTNYERPEVDKHIQVTEPCYTVIKQAVRAFRVLKRMRIMQSVSLDLSYGNIMKRKNGEYVLTDPFGSLCLQKEGE